MAMPDQELARRQRVKNITLALMLIGLVLLFYLVTIVKLGGDAS
jgi:hypothetical protein